MEHPIIQIKNAITALLKGIDPDTDVFYEEIKGTEVYGKTVMQHMV